jgi:YVTN family beta-propeller protein
MKLATRKGYCGRLRHVWLLLGMLLMAVPLSAKTALIYVANRSGDSVNVIDPKTDKVVQVIEGIELPHGVDFSPDGSRVYISGEGENALYFVDQKSGKITNKVSDSGDPQTIAVTKDGRRVFVGIKTIHDDQGALDVIDTTSLERVKTIQMNGPVHDIYLTPDGKYVVAGSESGKFFKVVDVQTEQIVWEVKFDREVRSMAIESGPDGSTRRIFVNLGQLHGFAVVDFATHKEVARIALPQEPSGYHVSPRSSGNETHGIGVAPDGKTLWVNSKDAKGVFVYSLPDLKLLGHARTGWLPQWITFTPDSKKVYVSNLMDNAVSVIDAETLKMVAQIPLGQDPEDSNTLVLP